MIERVSGVLLHSDDARYLLDALDALLIGRTPTARLGVFIERLRRNAEKLAPTQENTSLNARNVDLQQNSGHIAQYDLVDSAEAARILGCTPANVRDLARRGRIPRHRAGRGWVYPAASVVALAEKRAAKRG
ncbi:helix-turn-helix domain-containing protein [Mycolicibacterium frederiksbergense]|uniref:helix-turn-helix domain-containing protein n=1 Tax=Mycolicibacterium frederiksbergense TaxID=117567 RepID=UPI00265C422B|nr:helix-turn-helix domain-containing protein [Mycolicibacterium frederiksbergense]MDO0975989.1 helix-turn-helix domain-containing protein [Mycolicibacterium frederiksbergense]